jgi:hypothetical protein
MKYTYILLKYVPIAYKDRHFSLVRHKSSIIIKCHCGAAHSMFASSSPGKGFAIYVHLNNNFSIAF